MFEARGKDPSQRNADGFWTPPISATYVTVRTGRIVLGHCDPEWRVRLDPEQIIGALEKLAQQALDDSSGGDDELGCEQGGTEHSLYLRDRAFLVTPSGLRAR